MWNRGIERMRANQYELIVFHPSLFDNDNSNQFQFKLPWMMMKMDPYCGEFRISLATFNLDMTTNIAMEQNIDFRISTQCFTEFMEAVYKYAVEI